MTSIEHRDETAGRGRAWAIPALFVATIFLSAALLFFVQPLFARIVLPKIGGAPAVWTTAMLFFQVTLIAGYAYAHLVTRYLPVRAQVVLHLAFWAAALTFLPLAVDAGWRYDPAVPTALQTLGLFAVGVGVPFAMLSANAPLIQSWYAASGGPAADDPYFLYGASNLGSLLALLAFPLVAEPLFGATEIGRFWTAGFIALGALLAAAGLCARPRDPMPSRGLRRVPRIDARRVGTWLFLAFLPSSLMLSVTARISTDIGAFPLIWVVPLALYLLTFVLTFRQGGLLAGRPGLRRLAIGALVLAAAALVAATPPAWRPALLLLAAFFAIALAAHGALYRARPDERNLTFFYMTMSVGGALGGFFNSILAPVLFDQLLELQIGFALAALLVAGRMKAPAARAALGGAALAVALSGVAAAELAPLREGLGLSLLIGTAVAIALAGWFLDRRGLAVFAVVFGVLVTLETLTDERAILRDRSFFGTHTVEHRGEIRSYANGTTIHGAQRLDEIDGVARPTPLSYYHPSAPMGRLMAGPAGTQARAVGVVGQGVGALACYARPGQDWHYYEIDPIVDRIARNPALFTFLSRCTPHAPTHLGDARIVLEGQKALEFDILVIDAYSSDAVPVHLSTTEAIALYRDRITETGLIVFHISNNYYDLARPLGRAASALGLAGAVRHFEPTPAQSEAGAMPSRVAILSPDPDALAAALAGEPGWAPLGDDGGRLWTDDYANLLSILK